MPDLLSFLPENDVSASEGAVVFTIGRVRFTASDTGWSVLVGVDAAGVEMTAVGTMLDPHAGETMRLVGEWIEDSRHGKQFKFETYEPQLPTDAAQAEAYLASGRISGIGPGTAQAIVRHFGDQTLLVLDGDIDRLTEVPGIGKKKLATIREGWEQASRQRAIMIALTGVGASAGLAGPIWDAFGADGAALVTEQPYALTKARGVGFSTCDQIAARLGWSRTDPRRLSAGLAHALDEAQSEGHCYLPVAELVRVAARLLAVRLELCEDALELAVAEQRMIRDGDRCYHPRLYRVETGLAEHVLRLVNADLPQPAPGQAEKITALLAEQSLTDEQEEAVRAVTESALTILTGGPGVGKSHTVATVVRVAELMRWRVRLCAPTGRAARRMSELADGAPAATVHRTIGFATGVDGHTEYDEDSPLPVDLLVCDETSMLDVSLARLLLRAIPSGARVLFVGDTDQLPSVGPGAVLADLIASGRIRSVALTQIFRQAAASGIVQVAHAVNAGSDPQLDGWDDLHFWALSDPDAAAAGVERMVCERLPAAFGVSASDIQVLAPQKKGSCGVKSLNARLQRRLNPGSGHQYTVTFGDETIAYRPGDRIIVTKNNYEKGAAGVFNGTPAMVSAVCPEGGDEAVTIITDDGEHVSYAASEMSQLALAYAITIHKSQGSQYPCVVIPVTMQSYMMLVRKLIYTAITRAQSRVVLIGDPKALARAVRADDAARRYTGLADRLTKEPRQP